MVTDFLHELHFSLNERCFGFTILDALDGYRFTGAIIDFKGSVENSTEPTSAMNCFHVIAQVSNPFHRHLLPIPVNVAVKTINPRYKASSIRYIYIVDLKEELSYLFRIKGNLRV